MKERPLLASAESVLAYLDNRKTQTRRLIRQQFIRSWRSATDTRCPYGGEGDHLYIREAFGYVWPDWCDNGLIEGEEGGIRPISPQECDIVYRATDPDYLWADDEGEECAMWKPSIFMPKSRARIWLEVTAVKAQRLHDITADDAVAEGVYRARDGLWTWDGTYLAPDPVAAYAQAWDALNAKRGYPWERNWWVWVVTTRTLQGV